MFDVCAILFVYVKVHFMNVTDSYSENKNTNLIKLFLQAFSLSMWHFNDIFSDQWLYKAKVGLWVMVEHIAIW